MNVARLTISASLICVSCAVAHFLTERSRINPFDEPQVRAIASALAIGMREEDALKQLSTNGLELNSTLNYGSNHRFHIYCFTNNQPRSSCGLRLEIHQTNNRLAVTPTGVLRAVLLNDVQIARTNEVRLVP